MKQATSSSAVADFGRYVAPTAFPDQEATLGRCDETTRHSPLSQATGTLPPAVSEQGDDRPLYCKWIQWDIK